MKNIDNNIPITTAHTFEGMISLLYDAVDNKNFQEIDKLIKNGPKKAFEERILQATKHAAFTGNLTVMEYMSDNYISNLSKDSIKHIFHFALTAATGGNNLEIVEYIINNCSNSLLNSQSIGHSMNTALQMTGEKGKLSIVKFLIGNGREVDRKLLESYTPIIKKLIKDIDDFESINCTDDCLEDLLMMVVDNDNLSLFKLLIPRVEINKNFVNLLLDRTINMGSTKVALELIEKFEAVIKDYHLQNIQMFEATNFEDVDGDIVIPYYLFIRNKLSMAPKTDPNGGTFYDNHP